MKKNRDRNIKSTDTVVKPNYGELDDEYNTCPICGSSEFYVCGEDFDLYPDMPWKCDDCGFLLEVD